MSSHSPYILNTARSEPDPNSYSYFRVFSPECTFHTAIAHVISVLEQWRLTHDYVIGIHVRLHLTNTFIT